MSIQWTEEVYKRCYRADDVTGLSREFWRIFANEPIGTGNARKWWRQIYEQRIQPVFGTITGAQRILVVGCGLGLLVEDVVAQGFQNIWGIDSSAYVESLWPVSHPNLAHLDIRTATDAQFRSFTGGTTFDWVLTESVLESYPEEEQAEMYDSCEALLARNVGPERCVHLVFPDTDMTRWPVGAQIPQPDGSAIPEPWAGQPITPPGCPARSMEEWQASRPGHTFLSMVGVA